MKIRSIVAHSTLFILLCGFAASAQAEPRNWKSFFVAGDHSIPNFDNGRKDLSAMLEPWGAARDQQTHFSSTSTELRNGVLPATLAQFATTFSAVRTNPANEGCFVHMTSHGIRGGGFYLSQSGALKPAQLAKFLDDACGTAPTVVMISACYSGQFISPEMMGPNRIILTAAIKDRPSFGCSEDTTYTYWDGCLLETFPQSNTWKELYAKATACVERLESAQGFNPSLPQAFFGESVGDLRILNK